MREMRDMWIGATPETWKMIPLKYLASYNDEVLSENTDDEFEFDYIEIGSVQYGRGIIYTEHMKFKNAPSRARRIVRKDDIIVSTVRTYLKAVATIPACNNSLIASTGFIVIRPHKVLPRFMNYALLSESFISLVESHSTGISYPAINSVDVVKFKIPVPCRSEQERIAAFLDAECAEIDAVLEKTRASIEEYKKLKQAVITQAVTKGIRGDRPMKDSGIEWIGAIQKDWGSNTIAQLCSQVKCKNTRLQEKNLLSLSYGKVKRKSIDTVEGLLPESFDGYNIIEKDDIVLRLTDLQNDHTSLRVGLAEERGIITSAYLTIRNRSNMCTKYLYYYLHSFDIAKGFYGMGAGVRQGLNWDGVKWLKVLVPSVSEQEHIVAFLDAESEKLDALIAKKQQYLTEIENYKKSLIYEYVTGKKEVV